MRNSIAGAWLYSIVLIFMVFMIGFVAISINYNKVYKAKTNIVNIIEEYQGVNNSSITRIQNYLKTSSAGMGRKCETIKSIGTANGSGKNFVGISENRKGFVKVENQPSAHTYRVCITKDSYPAGGNQKYPDNYYSVYMFFDINLPVFGSVLGLPIQGETNSIYYPVDLYPNL